MEQATVTLSRGTGASLITPDLFERVAHSDRQAFNTFYTTLAPRVYGLAVRMLRDTALAEEVTQEIFTEIWQRADTYNPTKGSVYTWTMTITHRRVVDRIRAVHAARERDLRIGIRDWEPTVDEVASMAEIRFDHEKVANALGRLTELQQQVIRLAYYHGLSYKEIAQRLNIPTGTVKTRLRDGMIRLRDEMGVTG